MNVRNCRKCGKMFNYVSGPPICMACREAVEKKFQEVKEYVRENKMCTVSDVSRECSVEISQVNQWIREERLVFSDDSPIGIPCENCGATIKSGRFCEACKASMTQEFKSVLPKKAEPQIKNNPKDNPKMRFLDR